MDVKAARERWFEGQLDLDPETLVFIDETGATTKMARLRGRAPKGERCRAAVPHGRIYDGLTSRASSRRWSSTALKTLKGLTPYEAICELRRPVDRNEKVQLDTSKNLAVSHLM